MRGEIKVELQGKGDGTVDIKGTLDGKPLPASFPLESEVTRLDADKISVKMKLSFDPERYEVIQYEGEKNETLVLIPKSHPNRKIKVYLDAETRMPKFWVTFEENDGVWHSTRISFGDLKAPKARTAEPRVLSAPTVIMYLNQKASFTVQFNG